MGFFWSVVNRYGRMDFLIMDMSMMIVLVKRERILIQIGMRSLSITPSSTFLLYPFVAQWWHRYITKSKCELDVRLSDDMTSKFERRLDIRIVHCDTINYYCTTVREARDMSQGSLKIALQTAVSIYLGC